jgi:threonine 3-dehydrogenase
MTRMMKALGKLERKPGLWLYEAPIPTYGPNDLFIKVKKAAICGTDLHIYKWDEWSQNRVPVPLTTGHEFVGVVEKVGSEVKNFKPGDRIAGEGHLICGHCRNCRAGNRHLCRNTFGFGYDCTGCFSEYFTLPASNAIPLPKEISDDVASILDPLGNATHTALSFDLVGEDVLVTGAGPIGLMGALIAKHVGARKVVITDVSEYRLNLAKKIGIQHTVQVNKASLHDTMKQIGIVEGFDVGLEMSGYGPALNQMIDTMNWGGKIALLGIVPDNVGVAWSKVIFRSLTLKGIYGREMYETWYKMIAMIQSGLDVSKVITHKFHYTDFQKAFDAIGKGECGKVILEWD